MGIFDSIRRRRLTQQGLSSGKKRRTQTDGAVVTTLDRTAAVRYLIYGGFAALIGLLAYHFAKGAEGGLDPGSAVISSLMAVVMALVVFEIYHPSVARRNGHMLLVFCGLTAHLALIRFVSFVVESNRPLTEEYKLLLIPFALAPMIHAVLLGPRMGMFSLACTSVFGCYLVPPGLILPYLVMSLVCGLAAVLITRQVRKRGRLLRAGFYAGAAAAALACSFELIPIVPLEGGGVEWQGFGIGVGAVLGISLLTAMIVSGLLPILETTFTLTTDISWLELSDLNHKLLRRMQLEAPGTFHHSMVVASLSEAAAEAVGANPMVCRVSSYFHDIGKLNKPEYFIENQGEHNPHDALTPTMSALVIIAHVKDGVDIAIKNKLNPRIIDVIREHHGDSLVYYFYRKAQEQRKQQEEKVDDGLENPEDLPEIDEKNFRYPGPRPRSRESGIVSLADAVESASRSLRKPTPQKIRALVNDIVFNRIKDGQLDDCGLTVKDLKLVRECFSKTLRSMMHSRIDYPKKLEKEGSREASGKDKDLREEKAAATVRSEDPPTAGGKARNVVTVEELEEHRRRAAGDS